MKRLKKVITSQNIHQFYKIIKLTISYNLLIIKLLIKKQILILLALQWINKKHMVTNIFSIIYNSIIMKFLCL